MVGVSALEALAHCASVGLSAGAHVAAWMDAYRHDVFAALYRVTDAPAFDPDRLVELDPPSVDSPVGHLGEVVERFVVPSVVIGDGAVLYEATVTPSRVMRPPLLAGAIGRLAVSYVRRGGVVHPSAVHPLYVRRPDAEIAGRKARRDKVAVAIQPVTSLDQIDDVLAIEEASFTNPWTREMYLAELENPGVSFCYLARDAERAVGRLLFILAGARRAAHQQPGGFARYRRREGVASALLTFVLKKGRARRQRATLEVRQSNEAGALLVRAIRVYRWPVSGAAYYTEAGRRCPRALAGRSGSNLAA